MVVRSPVGLNNITWAKYLSTDEANPLPLHPLQSTSAFLAKFEANCIGSPSAEQFILTA